MKNEMIEVPEKRKIDVTIFGSSRPQLIPFMWESFKKMVIFSGEMRVIWSEDCVFSNQSKKVRKIVMSMKENGEVDKFFYHNPKIGLALSMDRVFKQVETEYIFYLQEDWLFERPIDLDQILWVMDNNPQINCIFFNKIKTHGAINKIPQKEFDIDGLRLCIYQGWAFLPGVWRMDKVRKHWSVREYKPEGYFTNQLGTHEERSDLEYLEKNVGCYIYGPQGDWRYVRHIGCDWRMADWRLENDGRTPGGNFRPEIQIKNKAPWVFYPICPVRKK